jgi:hypothetical protein
LLPPGRYRETDDAPGKHHQGLEPDIPASARRDSRQPDAAYRVRWERSPFADAYVGAFTADLVRSFRLGEHDGTDVLAVGFRAPIWSGTRSGRAAWRSTTCTRSSIARWPR